MKYTFQYANSSNATVTVHASDYKQAVIKAKEVMDKRAKKQDYEPPVGWTLTLIGEYETTKEGT
jgi:hypothetical protein